MSDGERGMVGADGSEDVSRGERGPCHSRQLQCGGGGVVANDCEGAGGVEGGEAVEVAAQGGGLNGVEELKHDGRGAGRGVGGGCGGEVGGAEDGGSALQVFVCECGSPPSPVPPPSSDPPSVSPSFAPSFSFFVPPSVSLYQSPSPPYDTLSRAFALPPRTARLTASGRSRLASLCVSIPGAQLVESIRSLAQTQAWPKAVADYAALSLIGYLRRERERERE